MLAAQAADLANPLGPDGKPTNLGYDYYSGSKISYYWTNYDSSYSTEIDDDGDDVKERTVGPGVARWDSGSAILKSSLQVRHKSGGLFSAGPGLLE